MAGMPFNGNSSSVVDAKWRVAIPVSYREALGENFTLALNSEANAIALYPLAYWEKIDEDLKRLQPVDKKAMRYNRAVRAFSFPGSQLDGQGRVLLQQPIRQKVGIDEDHKQIRFVGVGDFLEIWTEESFLEEMETIGEDREELLEYVKNRYYPV